MAGEVSSFGVAGRRRAGNPYAHGLGAAVVGSGPGRRLQAMGEMGALAVRVLRTAVRSPFSWVAEVVGDVAQSIRRCAIPLALSHSVYLIGFGVILFGNILLDLGIP